VVEPVETGRSIERLFGVTFFTIAAQVIVVRIIVTTVAIFKRHPIKTLKRFTVFGFFDMAIDALYGFVFAQQCEVRFIVVEPAGGFKRFCVVALGAVVTQRFLVGIFMAGVTGLLQSQKSVLAFFQTPIFHKIGFMAVPAFDPGVFSGEVITGHIVFEVFFIEPHHIKIAAMVIAVAAGAIFPTYFLGGVETAVTVCPVFDFFVAVQAFIITDLAADIVALGTIGHPFQPFVCISQVAGRQLSRQPSGEEGKHEDEM
jgi:hypothetical protein